MDIQLLYKVVLPTLARSGVAFIGISTLDDPFSFWSQMIELEDDDGKPVFKTIRYSLVCEDCSKKGLEKTCKHKMGDLPYWQDETQHNKLEKIMQDKSEAFLTETKGFMSNPNIKPAFESKLVQEWMKRPYIGKIKTRASVFISVDPAAGGNLSDYAIVTCCYSNGHIVVLGAEAVTYKSAVPQADYLINHIVAIRSIPGLESSYAVVVVESNLGNEAMHHKYYLKQSGLRKIVVMNEDTHDRPGLRTTINSKRTMVIQLNEAIRGRRIDFYENFVTAGGNRTSDAIRNEILSQVANFKRVVEPPLKTHQEPKERYSGKSGGGKDDLVLALMQNLYAKSVFYARKERYGEYFDIDS